MPLWGQERSELRACIDSCSSFISAGEIDQARRKAEEALEIARALGDSLAVAEVLVKLGNASMLQGDYNSSLRHLLAALRIHETVNDPAGRAATLNSIGSIHFYDRNYAHARRYYEQSLAINKQLGNASEVAKLTGNLGAVLEELKQPDSALVHHRRHLAMRRALDHVNWIPICYSNLGTCFDKLGQSDSALHYLQLSVGLLTRSGANDFSLSSTMTMLGVARLHAGQHKAALRDCREALEIAERLSDLPMIMEGCKCLYNAHAALGDAPNALAMHMRYIAMRDSLSGEQRAKDLMRLELNYHFENERLADSLRTIEQQRAQEHASQMRIAHERDQKRLFIFSSIGVLLLALALWSRLRYIRRSRNLVQQERDRSEKLLLNILPKPIADELKAHGRAKARDVDGVTILFTDFHDFTRMSERLSAHELVEEIDACYRAFDRIAASHGLEKIKTIGDAYMAAAGLPEPRPNSARDAVRAALAMQAWLKERAQERSEAGASAFAMRAGLHTGSVIAGIVGDSKFQYDVWGDTVNTAAHIEAAGAVGEVNISEATFDLIRDEAGLTFSPRGRVRLKSKGEVAMFFVHAKGQPAATNQSL